jgi:hypothetical protein
MHGDQHVNHRLKLGRLDVPCRVQAHGYNCATGSRDQRQPAQAIICHSSNCREQSESGQSAFTPDAEILNKEVAYVPKN